MSKIYKDDYGFTIDFVANESLVSMTQVRMIIEKPSGAVATYDFQSAEYNTVDEGDTITYTVRQGDFDEVGTFTLQLVAKNANMDIAFKQFYVVVDDRLIGDQTWQ